MFRALALSAVLALPALADAKPPKWFRDGADAVRIDAAVEAPLVRDAATDQRPAVFVTIPGEGDDADEVERLALLTAAGPSRVPEALATEQGWRVRGSGSDRFVVIPEVAIGEARLVDVRARIGSELVLGLGTLDEIAVAILPSTGQVRLAPAAQADQVLAAVADPIPVERGEAGKWFHHGVEQRGDPLGLRVPGTLHDAEGLLVPDHAVRASRSIDQAPVPDSAIVRQGEQYAMDAADLGGVDLPPAWFHHVTGEVTRDGEVLGVIGHDALYGLDVALDPGGDRIAIAVAGDVQATDASERLLELAREAFAAAEEEATADEGSEGTADEDTTDEGAETDEAGDPAAVGRHTALADALWVHGDPAEALEHYRAAADQAGERCGPYLTLGRKLLAAGQTDAAVQPLERATTLWHRWWSQDLEIRQRVQEGKKVDDDVFDVAQSPVCHEAWGDLAGARYLRGEHEAVIAIDRAHRQFDPAVPLFHALSALVQGEPGEADAAARQALQIGGRDHADVLLAAGFAAAGEGDAELVRERLAELSALAEGPDLARRFAALWLAREALGDEAALATADAMVHADPLSAPARLARWIAFRQLGGDLAEAGERITLAVLLTRAERQAPDSRQVAAWRALYDALAGDAPGVAERLELEGPWPADHGLAAALARGMAGDDAGAAEAFEALLRRHPGLPLPLNWSRPGVTQAP